MLKIKFTIDGNQEDPNGNPLGYKRTLNHSWRADSTRYMNWEAYVRNQYQRTATTVGNIPMSFYGFPIRLAENDKPYLNFKKPPKPIALGKKFKIRMDLMIYFKDDVRSDPDNVFKGIADALFENDKYVAGSFDYEFAEKGRVEALLTITETKK